MWIPLSPARLIWVWSTTLVFFGGGACVSCSNKFLTINYLDQHRSFVTLHRFPGDHDELDQNGFSRKGKNPLVLKVEVYPWRKIKHSATHRRTHSYSRQLTKTGATRRRQTRRALTGTRGRIPSAIYLLCNLSRSLHLFSRQPRLRLPLTTQTFNPSHGALKPPNDDKLGAPRSLRGVLLCSHPLRPLPRTRNICEAVLESKIF